MLVTGQIQLSWQQLIQNKLDYRFLKFRSKNIFHHVFFLVIILTNWQEFGYLKFSSIDKKRSIANLFLFLSPTLYHSYIHSMFTDMMSRQKYLFPVKYLSCIYDTLLSFEILGQKYKVVVENNDMIVIFHFGKSLKKIDIFE